MARAIGSPPVPSAPEMSNACGNVLFFHICNMPALAAAWPMTLLKFNVPALLVEWWAKLLRMKDNILTFVRFR